MNEIVVPTFLNVDLKLELSSIGNRVFAYIIDWVIKIGYLFLISIVFKIEIFRNFNATLFSFLIFSPVIFYSIILEWLNKGQTIGKLLMGIKVIGIEGNAPSISQCAIRWLFLFVDAYLFLTLAFLNPIIYVFSIIGPMVGGITIMVSKNQQRVGDIAASTIIVKAKETEYSIFDTIYGYNSIKKDNYEPVFPEIMKLSDKDLTIIKRLLERSEVNYDDKLAEKAANHVKKILNIESSLNNYVFLKKLLEDYNYLSVRA